MLTAEEAKELFSYDKKTGILKWRKRFNKHIRTNRVAGGIARVENRECLVTKVNKQRYYVHRIIFLIVTGEWPPEHVDHIDGDAKNNKWKNLRLASCLENNQNRKRNSSNTSGQSGVSFWMNQNRWVAQIWCNNKRVYLGSFKHLEDAMSARKAAEVHFGFHPNHGRKANAETTSSECD